MREIENVNIAHAVTVGEARKIGLSNPKVAEIYQVLQGNSISTPMKPSEVTRRMRREEYKGWRKLNMLVLSFNLSFTNEGYLYTESNNLNPNRHTDQSSPFDDKDFKDLYEEHFAASKHSWFILAYLAKKGHLSSKELKELNGSSAKKWMSTFNLVNAGWATDSENCLSLTHEGREAAIDLSIAEGYEKESAQREVMRTVQDKVNDGNDEIIRLKGNIYKLAENKARAELQTNPLTADSLSDIDPLKLRDLLIFNTISLNYKTILMLQPHRAKKNERSSYFTNIAILEEILTFISPEEYERTLESLGREVYRQVEQRGMVMESTYRQMKIVQAIYNCLKFVWDISGQKELDALQDIQQTLNVPFWSNAWSFRQGLSSVYNPQHTKSSAEEEKITIGSIVNMQSVDKTQGKYVNYFDDEELEVLGFDQKPLPIPLSILPSNYQTVYLKDERNWIQSCYLQNIRLAE